MINQEVLVPETDLKPIDDIEEVGDQQDDECVECYCESDSRKDLEVHNTMMVTMKGEILSSWFVAKVLNVRIVILYLMLKGI